MGQKIHTAIKASSVRDPSSVERRTCRENERSRTGKEVRDTSESSEKERKIMCKSVMICLAIVAAVLVSSSSVVQGQTVPASPSSCSSIASSLSFNDSALAGQWFEVARNPSADVSCIQVNVDLWNNTNVLVNVSHSSSQPSLYMDVNEKANITLVASAEGVPSTAGYNVTFQKSGVNGAGVYIKLLSFNYTYLVGCGYTNASNVSTSYGFILARSNYTAADIATANNNASLYYSNFQNGIYGNVTQVGCYASSASQTLPMIAGFVALAMALIFKA
ncbi:uncharacterized protein LOC108157539 [Drosophila miranda]|uniref:uncharacterized protein LOC108157539 n=1 Tax=Drosophila miranda TaxID=7229 RepID=UPI00143F2FC5|nr:uncharacterized protein LOC108157539 [Drosophila miranda]